MTDATRALVEYRLEEAQEALEEAEILLASGKSRGAMNRSYYAMFYGVLALLATRGLSAAKHSGAIATFHREFVKPGTISVKVARLLDIAFDLRNKSDYRDFVRPDAERSREMVIAAGEFVREVRAVLAAGDRGPSTSD